MKEIKGYIDISNLVHRTIQGYFNNLTEIKEARNKKNEFETKDEYQEYMNNVKEKVIKEREEEIQFKLLHMTYVGFESFKNILQVKEENLLALLDSKSWRKEEVKNFYENNKDETVNKKLYKNGRKKTYEDIIKLTISNIESLLRELNFNVYKENGLEADDLIAIIIRENQNNINKIVSNDIDFLQLQKQEDVLQYSPIKKEFIKISKDEAQRELYLKTLIGDSSDNIPSVYNFKLIKKDGEQVKFPRLGEGTIKEIIKKQNIKIGYGINEIINEIAFKIFAQQFQTPPFRKKNIDLIKKYQSEKLNQEKLEEIKNKIEEIIEEEKEYITKQLININKKIEKESDEKNKEKVKKLKNAKDLIDKFEIEFSFNDIKNKILNQYNHNNKIINFDFIPEDIKNNFLKNMKINKKTKTGEERKKIFEKYKLYNLAKNVQIEEKTKDNNKTIITTTELNKYAKISGYVNGDIKNKLEKLNKEKIISKIEIEEETYWIIKIRADDFDDKNQIENNKNILEYIKKNSKNLKENKDMKNKNKRNYKVSNKI